MLKFKKMITSSVQLREEQIEWLENKVLERSQKEKRRVSIAEIIREIVQNAIDSEN